MIGSILNYIGPGLGTATIVIVLIVLLIVILSIFTILWIPIKRFFKRISNRFSK